MKRVSGRVVVFWWVITIFLLFMLLLGLPSAQGQGTEPIFEVFDCMMEKIGDIVAIENLFTRQPVRMEALELVMQLPGYDYVTAVYPEDGSLSYWRLPDGRRFDPGRYIWSWYVHGTRDDVWMGLYADVTLPDDRVMFVSFRSNDWHCDCGALARVPLN